MPLLKFLKDGYESNTKGSTAVVESAEDVAWLVKKGFAEELPADALDNLVTKSLNDAMAAEAPRLAKGMTDHFDALQKTFRDSVAKAPVTFKFDDSEYIRQGASLIRKSAASACRYPEGGMVTKSFKRTQDMFKSLGHFASFVRTIGPQQLAMAEHQRDFTKSSLPEPVTNYLTLVRKSDDYADLVTKADPTGLGESISSEAGILVPPEFSMQIFERVYGNPLLQMTDTYPISSNQMKFMANAERSRVDGSRKGGVRGYWKSEAAQYTASKPTFRDLILTPHKLTVFVYATEELMEDSAVSLDQYLASNASDEINFKVGDAILNGTGVGQPLGVLNAPATVSISKETGQAAGTIVSENVLKMYARMYAPSRMNSVWLYNQDCEPQLNTMALAVGTGGQLTYTPPGGLASTPFATLMGRPMVPTEFNATVGTVGDLMLVDLSQYLTCTRGTIKSAMSLHLRFDYDEAAFKFSFRVDGKPWWDEDLTPYKGSNNQSNFITLATRA